MFRIESWKQRKKNIRILLRHPRYVYSHIYVGKPLLKQQVDDGEDLDSESTSQCVCLDIYADSTVFLHT